MKHRLVSTLSDEDSVLQRLHGWLRYERLTGLLAAAAFFVPFGLVASVLVALAVAFTPYMLWVLYRAGWHKAIRVFVVLILLPAAASWFAEGLLLRYALAGGSLVGFYLYTWVLHYLIGEYLSEAPWRRASGRSWTQGGG